MRLRYTTCLAWARLTPSRPSTRYASPWGRGRCHFRRRFRWRRTEQPLLRACWRPDCQPSDRRCTRQPAAAARRRKHHPPLSRQQRRRAAAVAETRQHHVPAASSDSYARLVAQQPRRQRTARTTSSCARRTTSQSATATEIHSIHPSRTGRNPDGHERCGSIVKRRGAFF